MTESEDLFTWICNREQWVLNRILETHRRKTPDYTIKIGGLEIVCEIKQIDPTKQQLLEIANNTTGNFTFRHTPGKAVRAKINKGAKQIKTRSNGELPGLLVLYCNLPMEMGNPTEGYDIRVAMHGFDSIVLQISDGFDAPMPIAHGSGGSRKMTAHSNTSISAIATIDWQSETIGRLSVYHNSHAAQPLPLGVFAERGHLEFVLGQDKESRWPEWNAFREDSNI